MDFKDIIIYVDLDGTVADFDSEFIQVAEPTWVEGSEKKVPLGFFENLKPIDGAIDAVTYLADKYTTFFLSTPQWSNPDSWKEKRIWVEKHFGGIMHKKLVLSHDKTLLKGHFLIDDRIQDGVLSFSGKFVQFGNTAFPNWDSVIKYIDEEVIFIDQVYKEFDSLCEKYTATQSPTSIIS